MKTQNFRFQTATVIEFRLLSYEEEDEEDEESVKIMFYLYFIPGVIRIFIPFSAYSYFFTCSPP